MSEQLDKQWAGLLREWNGNNTLPGRNDHPAALFDLRYGPDDNMSQELLAYAITEAWCSSEFPMLNLDADTWMDLFSEFAFIDNGVEAQLPKQIPTLYRGCAVGHELGLAWSDDLEKATWFYQRNIDWGRDSVLLQLDVTPGGVLAHIHGSEFRDESEWLVDPFFAEAAIQLKSHSGGAS